MNNNRQFRSKLPTHHVCFAAKHPSQTKPTTGTNSIITTTANTEVIPSFIAKDDNRPKAAGFVKDFTNILDASGDIDAQHTTTNTGLSFTNAAGEPDIDRPVDDILDYKPPDTNPNIAPASLWNRQDISEFKEAIRKGGPEGIIKVGHGETVTIRVPTHEEGTSLFWEFATDHYDLGFGVLFEWTIADTNQVSVHVSESSDEEFEEEVPEGGYPQGVAPGDVESGTPRQIKQRDPNKPRQDEIIPVYRRDCHEEVYAGSHIYPGQGVYLLKFDNSYSLWRSKTLYYRVYYSK